MNYYIDAIKHTIITSIIESPFDILSPAFSIVNVGGAPGSCAVHHVEGACAECVCFLFPSLDYHGHALKMKAPTWTQAQLQVAIQAVVSQRMRFTQAAAHFGIPKGTLYDNILGKSKRMAVLDEAGFSAMEERAILDFCCETSVSPYNRRTKKSLVEILCFVEKLIRQREPGFVFTGLAGFRWWWAFCKKHSVVSLYYEGGNKFRGSKVKTKQESDED